MYHDIPESLRALIEPVVADHGFELVTAELAGKVVRVVIDTRDGDGRVPIDECAAVSRELASCFDAEAAMPGAYTLEVSSPGLDRVLAREKDFCAACGQEVKIETRRPIDGRRRFRGRTRRLRGRSRAGPGRRQADRDSRSPRSRRRTRSITSPAPTSPGRAGDSGEAR